MNTFFQLTLRESEQTRVEYGRTEKSEENTTADKVVGIVSFALLCTSTMNTCKDFSQFTIIQGQKFFV